MKVCNFCRKKKIHTKEIRVQEWEWEKKASAEQVRRTNASQSQLRSFFPSSHLVDSILLGICHRLPSYYNYTQLQRQSKCIHLIMMQIIGIPIRIGITLIHNFPCLSSFVSSLMWWNQWSFAVIDKVKEIEERRCYHENISVLP